MLILIPGEQNNDHARTIHEIQFRSSLNKYSAYYQGHIQKFWGDIAILNGHWLFSLQTS